MPSVGRKRRKEHAWMPLRVYRGKSAYEFHPKVGGCVRLCALDAPRSEVWHRYEQENTGKRVETVSALLSAFFGSPELRTLATDTRRSYARYRKPIEAVFGHRRPRGLRAPHIRRYMDARTAKPEGSEGPERVRQVLANRELRFFSSVCSWGFERGWLDLNPCKGVKRFTETSRDRYVTDEEYAAVLEVAPPAVRAAMEIAYLCAARQKDVLELNVFQLKEEGIFIQQSKTAKKQIKTWTPRLRAAVELALAQNPERAGNHVIRTLGGGKYTGTGFHSVFYKAQRLAAERSGIKVDWTYHDLKAKGVSDYEGDKQRFSGHKTPAQVAVYDRKTQVVESLNVPNTLDSKAPSH